MAILFGSERSAAQRTEAEKELRKIWSSRFLDPPARKDPLTITRLALTEYTDSVFPNQEILRYKNLVSVRLTGRSVRIRRKDIAQRPVRLSIDTLALKELPSLRYLSLTQFDLSEFPDGIFQMKKLEGLELLACQVESLPDRISELHALKALHLPVNYLSDLPMSMVSMNSLKSLDLVNNHFLQTPKVISHLHSLRILDIGNREGNREFEILGQNWPFPMCMNHLDWESDTTVVMTLLRSPALQKLVLPRNECAEKARFKSVAGDRIIRRKVAWSDRPSPCPDQWLGLFHPEPIKRQHTNILHPCLCSEAGR